MIISPFFYVCIRLRKHRAAVNGFLINRLLPSNMPSFTTQKGIFHALKDALGSSLTRRCKVAY